MSKVNNEYQIIQEVYKIVQRVEDKMDDRFNDHEGRIRSTERFVNRVYGITAAVSIFFGSLASFVVNKVTGK